jgi:outer membrane protein assembly factor BamB
VGASWTTPIVIEVADKSQIITLALPFVISYTAKDGTELWRAGVLDGEVTPSPVFAGGKVFVVSPSSKLLALRPDGVGEVTQTHVAWNVEESLPDISSPVSDGDLVFTVTTSGLMACFDAKDGKKLWEHDFEMEVQASPTIADGRVYVASTHGDTVIVRDGREFEELSRTRLDDEFFASPAFAEGRVFIRGRKSVWCFGQKK